jgi:hypothetical protein
MAIGTIVMVAETAELVALIAVKDGTLPLPLAASPIAVLLFVQVNVVPDTGPVIIVAGTMLPGQND